MSRIFTFWMLAIFVQVSQAATLKFEKESLQITTDTQGPSFICKKGECKLCGNSSKTDTVCIVATDKGGRIHIKLTLNDKSLVEGDISGPGTRSICSRKNPIPNVEEICIIPKDVDIAKLHSCLDVSVKVKKTTISKSIGCFTIPKKNFLDRIVGEGDISINDISSILSFDASPETVDDGIYGSTICHKGICRMCKTYKHHEACVIAKALHNGMEVKVVSSKFVLVQGKITNNTDVSFCKQYPELKAICIVAWNISLKNMSACVNISVQFKDKTYNDAWGCFQIPNKADELQTFETFDSEDIDAATDSFGSDDVDDESDTLDSEDIDAVTDSFGSDDGDDESDTIELDEISMFGGENNDPSTRLQRAMLTFMKGLQEQTAM